MKNTHTKNTYITLRIKDKHKKPVRNIRTYKSRRIFSILKADIFPDCMFCISVRYPDGGRNEGEYTSKKDTVYALKAFLEK